MVQYQSIYRKWRPRFFEDVIGQEHIVKILQNAIKLNRVSHAYIFSGPRGVGKTTTARILAKALNCEKGPTEYPCNECNQCIGINTGQSMDVVEIDGASNRGIDEIRELRSKIGFAPTEGKYKVYIIDEVHMLTNEAFNALLKTLEEPPKQVLFIFATTAPQKIPNTILSRCQNFHFKRISVDEITYKLTKIADEENIKIELPSLRLIAEKATGSLRDAESLLDQVTTFNEEKISLQEVQEILGIIPHKLFLELMQVLISKDIEKGLAIIGRMVKDGIDFADFVQNMLIYTHKLSLMKILDKKNFSDIYLEQEDQRNLEKIISTTDADYFLKIIDELDIISDKIKQHIYPWILLELLIVKMAFYENKKNAEIADKSTEKNERTVIQKKTSFPPPGQAKTLGNKESDILKGNSSKNEKEQVSNIDIEKIWPKVLGKIKKEKISLYAFLMAKNRVYIENNCLMIGFRKDCLFHKESLEKRENKEKVETILKEEINAELKITCFIDDYIKNNEKELETIKLNEKALNDQHEKIRTTKKEEKSNDSEDLAILEKARDLFGGNISEE